MFFSGFSRYDCSNFKTAEKSSVTRLRKDFRVIRFPKLIYHHYVQEFLFDFLVLVTHSFAIYIQVKRVYCVCYFFYKEIFVLVIPSLENISSSWREILALSRHTLVNREIVRVVLFCLLLLKLSGIL